MVNTTSWVNTPCISIWSYINMYKCTTDLSPRNSIIVQSINVIISVYNPDTSISTNTNINSSTRYLIPCWATVLFFRNRLNWINRINYNRLNWNDRILYILSSTANCITNPTIVISCAISMGYRIWCMDITPSVTLVPDSLTASSTFEISAHF